MNFKGLLLVLVLAPGIWLAVNRSELSKLQSFLGIGGSSVQTVERGEEGHGSAAAAADYERGPHNGRMLRDGSFALEVTIFETNVPPEFRYYLYEGDKPIDPKDVQASVELHRLDGEVNNLSFVVEDDYLKSTEPVVEPHSFDVVVKASRGQSKHEWKYNSYEGRTVITENAAEAGGLTFSKAGPATIKEKIVLNGTTTLNQTQTAVVKARFPGMVKSVGKNINETVKQGEVLAVIEANTSMTTYEVLAPINGVVLQRNTNVGDVTGDAALFVISDLSTVWAEFHAFPKDIAQLKSGQPIAIKPAQGEGSTESTITLLTPIAEGASQSVIARVTIDNKDGFWRPGMTLVGDVTVAEYNVPLAVKNKALQRFRDFTVAFAKIGSTYEVRMLEFGKTDDEWSEVTKGIKPGTEYVADNSFLIKADIEKSGASHDH